jgi:methionyl aminopeptidase
MAAIYLKTEEEIELIRESSLLVGKTLAEVKKAIKPGITTKELDTIAETFILDCAAKPAFKGYRGFPASLCISVNEAVVHGIPGNYVVKEGDVLSVDCGIVKNGFFGDSAYTFICGEVPKEVEALLAATKKSLYLGIEQAVAGNRVGDISNAVQNYVESLGYSVVRELVGHGVGRNLHEAPDVPNYGRKGTGPMLKEGMVIAIEPMINMGKRDVKEAKDGWTWITVDGKPSAHFEHTIVIRKEKAEILSTFAFIENLEQVTI